MPRPNLKQATVALAFATTVFLTQVFDGLNSQASASSQQLEWERMLVGESEEADQAAAEGYSLRGEGVPDGVPFTIEGKPAPDDFIDAQCIDMHVREPCKIKVDRSRDRCACRVSSRSRFIRARALMLTVFSKILIQGIQKNIGEPLRCFPGMEIGGLLLKQDHGYEFEVVPIAPLSFINERQCPRHAQDFHGHSSLGMM